MTAPNHALTGALIGLSISNPLVSLPLALVSHFVCDMIPHYDDAEQDMARLIGSVRFLRTYLILGAGLCLAIALCLVVTRPQHWLTVLACAFLAASPDLFWLPRFLHVKRTGKDLPPTDWFLRFHEWIQWKTGPKLVWLEVAWFVMGGTILLRNV